MSSLEVYSLKPSQTLAQYTWIIELVFDACAAIKGTVWSSEEKVRILEKGIRADSRFKPLCNAVQLMEKKPNYEIFKMKALRIEKTVLLERTTRATLVKSLDRLRNPKYNVHHSKSSNGGDGSRSSSPKDQGKKKSGNNKFGGDNKSNIICFICNEAGHIAKSCPKRQQDGNNAGGNNSRGKGGKNMSNVNTATSRDIHDNYVKNDKSGKSVNHSTVLSCCDVEHNSSILSDVYFDECDNDDSGGCNVGIYPHVPGKRDLLSSRS
jgi:hypothetical protein